jgi:hypothetical protein
VVAEPDRAGVSCARRHAAATAVLPLGDAHVSCRGRLRRDNDEAADERLLAEMTAVCQSLRQK